MQLLFVVDIVVRDGGGCSKYHSNCNQYSYSLKTNPQQLRSVDVS